jgi:hypothetical protein
MLQMARVRLNRTSGWLQANRSEPFQLTLQPPPNAPPPPPPERVLPKVWAVSRVDAAVIALAEIARWVDLSPPLSTTGGLTTAVVGSFKLAEASYAAMAQPSAQRCVAACDADADCSAITFCAKRNVQRYCTCAESSGPGGSGASGCCFMMSHAVDAAAGGAGACRTGAKSNCGTPSSATCEGWSAASKLGLLRAASSATDYVGDEYQRWRNPAFSESYFDAISKAGDGSSTVWRLSHTHNESCGHCGAKPVEFELEIVANGTIAALLFNGKPLVPLQTRRVAI